MVNRYGIGHHSYDVPLKNYEPMLNVRFPMMWAVLLPFTLLILLVAPVDPNHHYSLPHGHLVREAVNPDILQPPLRCEQVLPLDGLRSHDVRVRLLHQHCTRHPVPVYPSIRHVEPHATYEVTLYKLDRHRYCYWGIQYCFGYFHSAVAHTYAMEVADAFA